MGKFCFFPLIWESVISHWFWSGPRCLFCFVCCFLFFNVSLLFLKKIHSSLFKTKFICFKKSIWLLCYGSPHKASPTVLEATELSNGTNFKWRDSKLIKSCFLIRNKAQWRVEWCQNTQKFQRLKLFGRKKTEEMTWPIFQSPTPKINTSVPICTNNCKYH